MVISITEFRKHYSKYLSLARSEEIIITKNKKEIAVLTHPEYKKLMALRGLIGIAKLNEKTDLDSVKSERLIRQ